jgi:predicted ribonuclease YlaK
MNFDTLMEVIFHHNNSIFCVKNSNVVVPVSVIMHLMPISVHHARLASTLVEYARNLGYDFKYDAQSGEIVGKEISEYYRLHEKLF